MPMSAVEVTPETLDAAGRALAGTGPVHMLNLLRYRAQAEYAQQTDVPPCSGREAYFSRYVPAFARVAEQVAPGERFMPIYLGTVQTPLVAPAGEAWDDIAIVEYPTFEVLQRIIGSREYKAEADPHRRAALADWRFYATTKVDLPG